jgi:hypothetical protein
VFDSDALDDIPPVKMKEPRKRKKSSDAGYLSIPFPDDLSDLDKEGSDSLEPE